MLIYTLVSVGSIIFGYAVSMTVIKQLLADNTELRVTVLEGLNRERLLSIDYLEFVEQVALDNANLPVYFDQHDGGSK